MISISTCMIVKNEENNINNCLYKLLKFSDEIIVVDTGSNDRTVEIINSMNDNRIHLKFFDWIDDFSKARNYALSFATKQYVYIADADEDIDDENINKILQLKSCLLEEIDIVQMYYTNQLCNGTTYNYDKEYRPKLYKRLRQFYFVDPIHEIVKLEPVVYDSDIEIIHNASKGHEERDFGIFLKNKDILNDRLFEMYARELFIVGKDKDFLNAKQIFSCKLENIEKNWNDQYIEILEIVLLVLLKISLIENDNILFNLYNSKLFLINKLSSEQAILNALFYKDYKEYYIDWCNIAKNKESVLNIKYQNEIPDKLLVNN